MINRSFVVMKMQLIKKSWAVCVLLLLLGAGETCCIVRSNNYWHDMNKWKHWENDLNGCFIRVERKSLYTWWFRIVSVLEKWRPRSLFSLLFYFINNDKLFGSKFSIKLSLINRNGSFFDLFIQRVMLRICIER
jgi:hypothetical protein